MAVTREHAHMRLRLSPKLKQAIKDEAKLAGMTMNDYAIMLLANRKAVHEELTRNVLRIGERG